MTIFSQVGWGKADMVLDGIRDNSISGVIWSPKDEPPHSIQNSIINYKTNSPNTIMLFDPQFYASTLPNVKDRYLRQYPYWKNLRRSDFTSANIRTYVEEVIQYQLSINVDRIVSPTIEINSFTGAECSIALALGRESIRYYNLVQQRDGALPPLLISFLITEDCFSSPSNLDSFLNEITILQCAGFYLIIHRNSNDYQASFESNALENLMYCVYVLSTMNKFETICGYTDFVGMLLSAVGAYAIATGWHANLRQFSFDRFLPSGVKRPAKPRYSSRPLINSILLEEMDAIMRRGLLPPVLSSTSYDMVFNTTPIPSRARWPQNERTLHHWLALQQLVLIASSGNVTQNLNACAQVISNAQLLYNRINRMMSFSTFTGDNHLQQWQTAISDFRVRVGV